MTPTNRSFRRPHVAGTMGFLLLCACPAVAQDVRQALLERVFGEAAKLDPKRVAKVKALPAGQRLLIDRDGDGRNDEAWFLDTAARHTVRPLLVRVIDEDGDLDARGGAGDLDSDLYLADWGADGRVDSAIDYQDNDSDGDMDEMGMYYFRGKDTLVAWWGVDRGDDNLLWYDVNWTYSQRLCQYRCHFGGDEWFSAFHLKQGRPHWVSIWENPFVFYDPDADGCSEVVARFEGRGEEFWALRYSFDADGDAHGRRAYDYDFSITALSADHPWLRGKVKSKAKSKVKLTDAVSFSGRLRGMPTGRLLRWEAARAFAAQSPWARACLTWDEMNANTEGNVRRDPHERWEGIIAHGSKHFPQIGGPPCSALNKRNEVSLKPAIPLRLYYDPTDRRLHLRGAGKAFGWLHVDYDLDAKADATYTYVDDDGDGLFDRRRIDLDADGRAEFDWKTAPKPLREVKLAYKPLSTFYRRELAAVLGESQRFIDAAKAALGDKLGRRGPVETFFLTKLSSWCPQTRLGRRMRSTPGGARLYVDLLRDRLLHRLQQSFGRTAAWGRVEAAYAAGRYAAAAELVRKELAPGAKVVDPAGFGSFTHRIPIRIDNAGGPPRENWPIVLTLKALKAAARGFNPANCAVVAPGRWIDWREVPHQIDEIDPSAGPELSFLADAPADASVTYVVHYSPAGTRRTSFPPATAAARDWRPATIGWESTRAVYRACRGRFGFFGKHQYRHSRRADRLILPTIRKKGDGPLVLRRKGVRPLFSWGIDALRAGRTSGLGGLTLYVDGRAWPVQDPDGKGRVKFTRRVLCAGPVRAAVEITATNVVPDRPGVTVRTLCIVYADRAESEIRASVRGGGSKMLLAPGLTRLRREEAFQDPKLGCLGAWGVQDAAVGEIGLGLIVPPEGLQDVVDLRDERRLRCALSRGGLRYWIVGQWRRGRRFPVAPTAANWRRELRSLAGRLHRGPAVTIGPQ